MNRKTFLAQTSAAMVAFFLPIKNNYAIDDKADITGDCVPTTTDILGPYYRANAPFRSNLVVAGETASTFIYKGVVTDENCVPLPNVIVDVWQANTDAVYDGASAAFNYRGKFQTGANGQYEFTSVKPGWYLNGAQYRPAHIHFRVTCPGYTELITQLYFEGDPYIANDPWASAPNATQRILPITMQNDAQVVTFNITLAGNTTGLIEMPNNTTPISISPNPFDGDISLTSSVQMLSVEVFNGMGALVHSIYHQQADKLNVKLNFLGPGVYFFRIETAQGIFVHRTIKQ